MSRTVGTKAWLLLEPADTMGRRIRFLRIALGMTQTQLASLAGSFTKSFISLVETDRTQPSVPTLFGIAKTLGTSMDYLWTGVAAPRGKPRVEARSRVNWKVPTPRTEVIVRRPGRSGTSQTIRVPLSREGSIKAVGIIGAQPPGKIPR